MESPREDGVRELIAALDAYQSSLYPPASNHFLDLEQLSRADIRFFVARRAGKPLACGALRVDASGYGEVKRMYVAPEARGRGVARRLLAALEAEAADLGYARMILETATGQPEAMALYESAGWTSIPNFGAYEASSLSRCYEKLVSPPSLA